MEYMYELTSEDESWEHFRRLQRKDENSEWEVILHSESMKSKIPFWGSRSAHEILTEQLGIETTTARATEFQSAHDCNYAVLYYLGVASPNGLGDEVLKLIMGPISAELNIRKMPIAKIQELIPSWYLFYYTQAQHDGKFDRSASKHILAEILQTKQFERYGEHEAALDTLFADPRWKPADSNQIGDIITKLVADNPDQVEKAKTNEKLMQWFVGQVMKATQGKANPQSTLEAVKTAIMG